MSGKTKIAAIAGVLVVAGIAGSMNESDPVPETLAEVTTTSQATTPTVTRPTTTTSRATTTTQSQFTRSEQNAIASAAAYLDFMAFSRKGLIEQLEYEGFSTAEATLAVDFLDVDWNLQAWLSA